MAGVRQGAGVTPGTSVANSQFGDRAAGGTAGLTTARGGQTVFANPAAKAKTRAKSKAKATPSARTASGDLWNGFKPQARSSVFAAESAAAQTSGGGPLTAALVVLGLGALGLAGSASVLGLRRRRAAAKSTGRDTAA